MARPSETGSRASVKPASGLAPAGFDPARMAGCAGKAVYRDKAEAMRTLKHRAKRGRVRRPDGLGSAHAYRCDVCKQWHIGCGGSW